MRKLLLLHFYCNVGTNQTAYRARGTLALIRDLYGAVSLFVQDAFVELDNLLGTIIGAKQAALTQLVFDCYFCHSFYLILSFF